MRFTLLLSITISILAVIFALQNGMVIDVDLGPFTFQGSVAFILLITFALGVIAGILVMLPSQFRKSLQSHKLKRSLRKKDKDQQGASQTEALPEPSAAQMVAPPPPRMAAPVVNPAQPQDTPSERDASA